MTLPIEISRQVIERADGRCEYCRMHQSLQGAKFHIEHIVPSTKGGSSDADNLGYSCPSCNLHKSDRVEAVDPDQNRLVPLFHPRTDIWHEHFAWDEYVLVAVSSIGRATIDALDLNGDRRQRIRMAEALFDLFPPDD